MNARHGWLALALIVTAVVAFWPEREDEVSGLEVVQAEKHGAAGQAAEPGKAPGAPADKAAAAAKVPERFAAKAEGDLFPRQTWVPPPPKPKKVKPLPPPPPRPPAFPFAYLGKWVEKGSETIFLTQGDRVLQVHQGDVLAINWRLDEVTQHQLVFTYLPLDMTQTMRISQ
jgi:hypothetical protein